MTLLQDDGFIAKLLQEAGAKDLAVGTPLAILVEEADAIQQFADYTASAGGGSAKEEAPTAAPGKHALLST